MPPSLEEAACTPVPLAVSGFNPDTILPYGLSTDHVRAAMQGFLDFLGFLNAQLHSRQIERLETMLMPANFSSIVGEFMSSAIPRHCPGLTKNNHHNGHPDMLPAGRYPGDDAQHVEEGIEIKGSRYLRGWQGHNPEDTWLMVFVFDSNRPVDAGQGIVPRPFRFVKVVGARLVKEDWTFAGRSDTSRRYRAAAVNDGGYRKMQANWIYQDAAARLLPPSQEAEAAHPEDAAPL